MESHLKPQSQHFGNAAKLHSQDLHSTKFHLKPHRPRIAMRYESTGKQEDKYNNSRQSNNLHKKLNHSGIKDCSNSVVIPQKFFQKYCKNIENLPKILISKKSLPAPWAKRYLWRHCLEGMLEDSKRASLLVTQPIQTHLTSKK